MSKHCCTSSTPSPPRCGSCSSPWLDAGSSSFWRLCTLLGSEPGCGAGALSVCGNEQSLGNQQRRHPPFPAPGSLPFSLQQTNCIDRQKQDYGEEICKTTGLWKLKQANTEIMFGVWVVGAGGGQGQGGSSNRAVRRWWRGSRRGGTRCLRRKAK